MIDSKIQILREEKEVKPNKAIAIAMIAIVISIILVWMANQFELFHLNTVNLNITLFISFGFLVLSNSLAFNPKTNYKPFCKYVLLGCILLVSLLLETMLNFHVEYLLVLPVLLSVEYASYPIFFITYIGASVCTVIAPILSYSLNIWDVEFLLELITLSGKEVIDSAVMTLSNSDAIKLIFTYISIPNLLGLTALSVILLYATRNVIRRIKTEVEIRHISETDKLTGLLNQNSYKVFLEEAPNDDKNVGVVFFDVNGLKYCNDNYGHECGDLLLARCAQSIRDVLGENDYAYRIGGDEFIGIFAVESITELNAKLAAWQANLQNINLDNEKNFAGLFCSMAAGAAFGSLKNLRDVMQIAEAKMYVEKKNSPKSDIAGNYTPPPLF